MSACSTTVATASASKATSSLRPDQAPHQFDPFAAVLQALRRQGSECVLDGTACLLEHRGFDGAGFDDRNVDSPRLQLGAQRIRKRLEREFRRAIWTDEWSS